MKKRKRHTLLSHTAERLPPWLSKDPIVNVDRPILQHVAVGFSLLIRVYMSGLSGETNGLFAPMCGYTFQSMIINVEGFIESHLEFITHGDAVIHPLAPVNLLQLGELGVRLNSVLGGSA